MMIKEKEPMKFTYENQGNNTYLVYTLGVEDEIDSMSLGMLTNNKIDGLATTLFMQMDATKFFKYNVSAKVSVKQFFTGPVNKKRLVGVFTGIVDAMISAEEYMIDPNSIIMDLEYMFADVSTCETVLICLPVLNQFQNSMDLGMFFKNIVFSTRFDQTENCDYVAKIINYLNSTPMFSLYDFKELLREIENQNISVQSKPQPVVPKNVQKENTNKNVQPVQVRPSTLPQDVKPKPTQEEQRVTPPQTNPSNQTFNVPGQKKVQQPPVQNLVSDEKQSSDSGKKMSMLYLLQHYNKENVAAYKAQKEAKSGATASSVAPKTVPVQKKEIKPVKVVTPPSSQNQQGFAIPGQNPVASQGFAIPGQQSPAPQGFAIPGQTPAKPEAKAISQSGNQVQQQKGTPVNAAPIQQNVPVQTVPQGKAMSFGDTTVLNAPKVGETTVLNETMVMPEVKKQPYLIRKKNNERIELNKPVFRIGKEKSYVDYFISDNTAISRSHANIITRDGEYFVVDTNSTNHTYINGKMIQSNVETKISDNDSIRFANEEFTFKLQ